jgi:phosphate-selective porin
MYYAIKFWETEEERDLGISELFLEDFTDIDLAIIQAKEMVDDMGYESVEVVETDTLDTDDEKVVYGYDGKDFWNNNRGTKNGI